MANRTPPADLPTPLSLDQLAEVLPAPDRAALDGLLTEEARAAFAAQGAEIASSKVLVDATRIFSLAHAFLASASAGQQAALVGFSPEFLALAVDAARRLRDLSAGTGTGASAEAATFAEREAKLRTASSRALGLRDQAQTVLIGLVGPASEARARVKKSVGTADTSENLAAGLERLAALGRELLADKKGAPAAVARLRKITPAYFDKLDEAARELRDVAAACSAPARTRPAQGELDLLDGLNLYFILEISRAFESAHELDPTIPRLLPIATRRLFSRPGPGKEPKAPQPVPPSS